ncbi:Na-Ca exchanger/integrin-beta4 [Conexibacter woesei DSM 14684]|uniref:Na-Ca exchanger/integrin-beta4 n=2 Tax=Conexibacter TaxID=191494 RepID=D3FC48_CONWI|nr:Na-Ca exchanger/integrin-beta4 [Conexibacter woesei DSM 14684]
MATTGAMLASLACSAPALAEPAAGVTPGGALATFDTARPGAFTSLRPIAGLQPGEYVGGIDYRFVPRAGETPPATSALYAIGVVHGVGFDTLRTYRIDTGTAIATQVGAPIAGIARTSVAPAAYGVDFNQTVDRIRVVNTADENLRINPNNGALAGNDTDLTAGFGVAAAAYDRVDADPATPTTLFGLAQLTAQLVRIGGVDGTPSPNTGAVSVVGPLGIASESADTLNMDIAPNGTAYATATPTGGQAGLYTTNLATGALNLTGSTALPLTGFAVLPAATAQFSAVALTAVEGTTATATVTRTGLPNDTASVRYATADGTATSADYAPASGTLTFAPGETSRTFTVATKQNGADGPDKTVALSLSDPAAPLTLGTPASATLTIADDDPAPPAPRAPDTRAPVTSLTAPRTVTLSAFLRRGITASARTNEPARLAFALEAAPRSARLAAAYRLTLATRTLRGLSAARRSVTLKPVRTLVGMPRKAFKVRVRVTATDAAGNARSTTRTVTVKPARARRPRR